ARDRARAGADRARGRLLRLPQALPERRLLLGDHLPGNGIPDRLLHGAVRARTAAGLARAVGGDALRSRAEDRTPAADLHGLRRARLRAASAARLRQSSGNLTRPLRPCPGAGHGDVSQLDMANILVAQSEPHRDTRCPKEPWLGAWHRAVSRGDSLRAASSAAELHLSLVARRGGRVLVRDLPGPVGVLPEDPGQAVVHRAHLLAFL